MEDAILTKLEEIRRYTLLSVKEMLTVDEAACFTGLSTNTLRHYAEDGRLPFYKPFGKLIYFRKSELDAALRNGRVSSISEIINNR